MSPVSASAPMPYLYPRDTGAPLPYIYPSEGACGEHHGYDYVLREAFLCTLPEGHAGLHCDENHPPNIPASNRTQPLPLLKAWPLVCDRPGCGVEAKVTTLVTDFNYVAHAIVTCHDDAPRIMRRGV